jgi:hypothetical protein
MENPLHTIFNRLAPSFYRESTFIFYINILLGCALFNSQLKPDVGWIISKGATELLLLPAVMGLILLFYVYDSFIDSWYARAVSANGKDVLQGGAILIYSAICTYSGARILWNWLTGPLHIGELLGAVFTLAGIAQSGALLYISFAGKEGSFALIRKANDTIVARKLFILEFCLSICLLLLSGFIFKWPYYLALSFTITTTHNFVEYVHKRFGTELLAVPFIPLSK